MKRPRILVTRTRKQASALAIQLEALGAEPILVPMIEIKEPTSFAELDAAMANLGAGGTIHDWMVFTSANAVEALAARARSLGIRPQPRRVAAIGPATAKAIERADFLPQSGAILVPPQYVAESLAESLIEQGTGNNLHYLLLRAEQARDVLPAALEAAGHRVTIAAAYRNITPPDTLPALARLFTAEGERPDMITFTSSSTAKNLVELLGSIDKTIPSGIALASVGPITSTTLRELGYEPTLEAAEPTIESLVLAIARHFKLG